MTVEIGIVFVILTGALVLFITGWVRADIVALLVLVALMITGLLPVEAALSGFASEAVIATAGLLTLSAGLVRSGVMRWISNRLDTIAAGKRVRLVGLTVLLPGLLSGLISDIGTVSLFIPVVLRLARKNDVPRRHLLLPLAMAVLAGGNLTLIGSSHNLVIDSLLQDAGLRGLGFFEIMPVGLALILAVALYTLLAGRYLLRDDEAAMDEGPPEPADQHLIDTYGLHDRLWEVSVSDGTSEDERSVRSLEIGGAHGLNVLTVISDGSSRLASGGRIPIKSGDILLIEGRRDRVEDFVAAHEALGLVGRPRASELFPTSNAELIEVVVPPRSPVVGQTLRDLDARAKWALTGVAIWRDERPFRTDVGTMSLEAGDAVLLYGPREQTRSFDPGKRFVWLQRPYEAEAPRELRHLGPWAAGIMVLVVMSAALNLLSISGAALAGAAAMVLLGILKPRDLYDHVSWETVVLIGAMYPLGLAMEVTGTSDFIATLLVDTLGAWGPLAAMLGILWIAMLLTQSLHGAAVVVMMTPVALATASSLQAAPRAFAFAVLIGASATYLLPVGHPVPLLVRRPGAYEIRDYIRYGLGLALLTTLVAIALLPLLWPF